MSLKKKPAELASMPAPLLGDLRLPVNAFPIRDALRHELSRTHHRPRLHVDDATILAPAKEARA